MRLLIGAATVALLGFAGLRCQPRVRGKPGLVEVTVHLRCVGDTMQFAVSPWTAQLAQNDSIDWVLDPAGNADSLLVAAKDTSRWPFANGLRFHGTRKTPAKGRRMKPGQQGTYQYSITLACTSTSVPRTVVIDPEMIIR